MYPNQRAVFMLGEVLRLAFKVIRALWRGRVQHFLLIWIVMTLVWASCTVKVVWRSAASISHRESVDPGTNLPTKRPMKYGLWIALTLLALFLAFYIALLLRWENFSFYDNSILTCSSLRGVNFPPPIYRDDGRFYPLAFQEFNLMQHFTKSVMGYYAVPIVELLILSCTLLILDKQLNIKERVGLIVLLLVTPGFVISFGGLIYPERNVVFCMVCLLLFVKRFEESQRIAWAVAAVVTAQIMIYEKETAFLLVLGLAIGGLLFGFWKHRDELSRVPTLRSKENRLYGCLALLTIPFLLYYAAATYPRPQHMYYNEESRLSLLTTCISYVKLDLLAWLFVIFLLGRAHQVLRRRAVPSPFWDGMALGGVLCFAAYLYLGLSSAYYLAPVNLIAVLYIGRFIGLGWTQTDSWQRIAIGALCTIVLLQSISLSAICLFQRKTLLQAKAAIAEILVERYRAGKVHTLFFPFTEPYVLNEFAAYLSYRGIPVEEATAKFPGPNRGVLLFARSIEQDGRCAEYLNFRCHAGRQPETGDLVVVLPDDNASLADVLPYRSADEIVFSYQPRREIPHALGLIDRRIHIASHLFYPFGFDLHTELPNRWLDASVAVWESQDNSEHTTKLKLPEPLARAAK